MTMYHRLTASGIESKTGEEINTMYTFQCKVCGYQCTESNIALLHYEDHAIASTFDKTLTGQRQENDPPPGTGSCHIIGCRIPAQYSHRSCGISLCPQHVVRHQKNCTFKKEEKSDGR